MERAGKLLKETTGTASELFLEKMARHLFQRCMHAGPYQEIVLFDCCDRRMVWQHVTLPPLDNRQRTTGFHLLQQTIHKV